MSNSQRVTIEASLSAILSRFQTTSPGITGAAVVDNDGFIIAAHLPQEIDDRRVAGMGAALVAIGERVCTEFQHGDLHRTFVEADEGYVTAISLGMDAALVVVARSEAKPGLVFLMMTRVAKEICSLMGL